MTVRLMAPLAARDPAEIARSCAQWLGSELGLHIVEYRIGNPFTGCIDILAAGKGEVHLVTVTAGGFGDALLGALTSYRWFMDNRAFLERLYGSQDVTLAGKPVLSIFSNSFPSGIQDVLACTVSVEIRLFRYSLMGTPEETVLCVVQAGLRQPEAGGVDEDIDALVQELAIGKAGLGRDEIRDFLAAMRAP